VTWRRRNRSGTRCCGCAGVCCATGSAGCTEGIAGFTFGREVGGGGVAASVFGIVVGAGIAGAVLGVAGVMLGVAADVFGFCGGGGAGVVSWASASPLASAAGSKAAMNLMSHLHG
jgi:hypothetical protein